MDVIVVFGPNFAKVTAELGIKMHRRGGGFRIVSSQSANTLPIPEGSFSPCTLIFAHYSLAGNDFDSSGKKLINGMNVTLVSLMRPKLDWWCDKSTEEVGLVMYWKRCDTETLRKATLALEGSYEKNTGHIQAPTQPAATTPGKTGDESSKSCFIATACYGSADVREVRLLRDFRDIVLLNNNWGRWFVRSYETISPAITTVIDRNRPMRTLVRALLVGPVVMLVRSRWKDRAVGGKVKRIPLFYSDTRRRRSN